MQDLDPILTEYVFDLKARGRAPATIRNYRYTLGLFAAWCDDQDPAPARVADVDKNLVTRWIALRAETEKPETVLTRFRHLRAFFKWAEGEDIIEKNPMRTLREPSSPTQPPDVLTMNEIRALFAETKGTDFKDRRDLAMLAFLFDTGCRVGELCGLRVEDLDFDTSTAEVLGKGRRRRVVAFGPKTGKALLAYLRARASHRCADEPWLWIGLRGKVNEAAVWKIVKTRGEAAGIAGLYPHIARHTFAHRFRLDGGQDGELAQLGGWRSPAMLARYGASAATERAVEAHRRIDPLRDLL
jgi:site-specific recombinase XerD